MKRTAVRVYLAADLAQGITWVILGLALIGVGLVWRHI